MKSLTKRIFLTSLSLIFSVCCILFAATGLNKTEVKADEAELQAEFTNDGEFAITTSRWGNTFSFIDGDSVGGTGAVLQANFLSGVGAAFKLDLSPMAIFGSAVESIVIRVKAANFTLGDDEFRTIADTSTSWEQYGKTDDLSDWFDYTLNAASIGQFTRNSDGTLGHVNVAIRSNTNTLIMYVDSITVTINPNFMEFTNNGQFDLSMYNNAAFQIVDGAAEGLPSGYDGAVLKVNNNGGWACVNVNFSASNIQTKNVDSIVVRIYSPGYTAADEFRTVFGASTQQMYGAGANDMSTWCDITLSAASIGDMTDASGYLTSIATGVRVKSGATLYYIDSITVNMAVPHAADTLFVGFPSNDWNNKSSAETSCNILTFSNNPLGDAANATNLAATANRTSLGVKYNGSTFFALYSDTTNANRAKYNISYAHGNGYFYFAIPEADLVDGATFEIEDGTPFMNYYLEGVTLTYDGTSGKWQVPINYNPSFASINSGFNNDSNGFFIAQFNTTGWAQNGVPTSYTGITYNGNDISDLTTNIKFFQSHSVWFTYTPQASNPKLAAYYHGYSHPTISFAEGATMVYGGDTYTFHAVTFYLNLTTNKWQTAIPDGYEIVEATTFDSIDPSSTADSLVLNYTDELSWTESKGNFASKITVYSGATPSTVTDGNLSKSGAKQITISDLSAYDKIVIEGGGVFGGVIVPAGTFYYNDMEDVWQTTKPYCDFESISAYYNNLVQSNKLWTILSFDGLNFAGLSNLSTIQYQGSVKYNGVELSTLTGCRLGAFVNGTTYGLFIELSQDIVSPYYNGYSHPKFEIAKGTVLSQNATTLAVLNECTLYDNLTTEYGTWQTAVPDGYEILEATSFVGLEGSSTLNSVILLFSDSVSWTESQGNIASHILLDGATTLAQDGGSVIIDAANKKITINLNDEYDTLSISSGAICGGVCLPVIDISVISGEWVNAKINVYTGTLIKSADGNVDNNNTYHNSISRYATSLDFDAKVMDWNQYPTAVSGIKVNGIELGASHNSVLQAYLVQLTDGLWIQFKENLASGYNGYSHPTITFEYCSYIETQAHERVYFDAVELYLDNGLWSTTVPAGYNVIRPTTLTGISASSTVGTIILEFEDDMTWTDSLGNIAEHVLLDGITLAQDGGSIVVDATNKTITINVHSAESRYGVVKITSGAEFGSIRLPVINLYGYYDGEWQQDGSFACTDLIGWYENLPFSGIVDGWNCMKVAGNVDTILRFGDYGKHFFLPNSSPSNVANSVGNNITINGVAVGSIAGVTVSYAHGFNHLYISIPVYELSPTDEYKCVELRIKAGTVIHDLVIGEVCLYLVDGQWSIERPTTIDVVDPDYLTAEDIFNGTTGGYYDGGVYTLTEADEDAIISSATATTDSVVYNFLYKSDSDDFDYRLLTYVGNSFKGVRVTVYRNEGESMQGYNVYVNGHLEGAKQVAFISGEWYAVRIAITIDNGNITVSVAVDGIEIIHAVAAYDGEVGEEISFRKDYGVLTFADFRTGDIKRPVIDWQGKDVYRFTVGEDKPEDSLFKQVLNITDNYDKAALSMDAVVIEWQDGAIAAGKLVAGEWKVTFSISDTAGNVAYFTTTVIVTNPNEIAVFFKVGNAVDYVPNAKGALVEKPVDPTKAADATATYEFDGWYYGDEKWDFVNDYAFNDIDLVARFKTIYKEYTVTIVTEGLEENQTITVKMRYGVRFGQELKDLLKEEGYSFKLMQNDQEVNEIEVTSDMTIKAVYTADAQEEEGETPDDSGDTPAPEKKSGCGSNIDVSALGVIALVIACAFVLIKKTLIRGRK